jgi:hypothetical protein
MFDVMGLFDKVTDAVGKASEEIQDQVEDAQQKAEDMEERAKEVNEDGADFRELENMPPKQQKVLEKVMFPDEEFVMSIRLVGMRNPPYLTVTDKRLLKTTPKMTGHDSESFDLSSISEVGYYEGLMGAELTISGSGINEEYEIKKKYHENIDEFQQEIYARK